MTDATPQDQHWTEGFPHLAERAATLLGIDVATVARHSKVVPGGFHVWTPGRGGAQAVVGFDGAAYVRESSFSQADLVAGFQAGHRFDPVASGHPLNHAASGAAALVTFLRTGQRSTATPDGPPEKELAELAGAPFRQTTPDEIADRLRARGKGAFAVVGIDRAHGPGHWYVAHFDGEVVRALDPLSGRPESWPPAPDAVRWWADGEPTRQPETVTAETRSRHGRRVWVRTTPELLPWTQNLLAWYATTDPARVAPGRGTWYGFWWAVLGADGDDLRVGATDLTKPGIETLTWDVGPMLRVLQQLNQMATFTKVKRQEIRFTDRVLVQEGVYEAPEVYLTHYPAGDGRTGWFLTTRPEVPRGGTVEVAAHEVWRAAPHLVRHLALPQGWRAMYTNNRTARLWNPDGELVWDVDARDAGPGETAASGETTASGEGTASGTTSTGRPRGSAAYEAARAALEDRAASREKLLAAAHGLRDAFVRNEHMIGLLPPDAVQVMVETYRRADSRGADPVSREAATAWVREAYFRELPLAAEAADRVGMLAEDDPDGAAHVLRGWMRFNGYGFPQDAAAAVADHEEAARRGNADALLELSILTATGQGTPVDAVRSRDLLERAAAAGHPRALYNLAAEHATGRGRPRDSARALDLYLAAADKGHDRAAFTAGVMVLMGDGALPDPGRAARAFALAEDLGFDVREAAGQLPQQLAEQVVAALDGA